MSDFDKEKEREKLREKYERDQEKRETAEKMSELLLQGATMTNAHCSECGDPIFRYDGQEFCATCEKPVDRNGDADTDADDDEEGTDGHADSEAIEVTSPSDDARVQFGGGSDDEGDASTSDRQPDTADTGPDRSAVDDDTGVDASPDTPPAHRSDREPPTRSRVSDRVADTASGGVTNDVSAARDSLVRTLSRFSEAAEHCEDPQRAREYLAAAREAAEALSALRR